MEDLNVKKRKVEKGKEIVKIFFNNLKQHGDYEGSLYECAYAYISFCSETAWQRGYESGNKMGRTNVKSEIRKYLIEKINSID